MLKTGSTSTSRKSPWLFFLIVFALSAPMYIFGPKLGSRLPVPFKLPVSALAFLNPLLAALILTPGRSGKKALLKKTFDWHKTKNQLWYVPVLLLQPLIFLLTYLVMRLTGMPLPDPKISLLSVPAYFGMFFFAGIFEELGWMGFAYEPLEERWGAFRASLILGIVWVAIHLIPDAQLQQAPGWIFWHRLGTIANRILMVWLFENTGRSVFAMILYHVSLNMGWALFPNNGSHYNPFLTTLFTLAAVAIALVFWKPRASRTSAPVPAPAGPPCWFIFSLLFLRKRPDRGNSWERPPR